MLGLVKVLGGVLVFRRVAAADMAAFQTQSQVDPRVVHFEALLAAFAARIDLLNFILMGTSLGHESPQGFVDAASASCPVASV
jgi:hypothetical protein